MFWCFVFNVGFFVVVAFFPEWNCPTLGRSRSLPSESSQTKRDDLMLPSAPQTVSVKASFGLNKTGALVFSVLHLLWNVIIALTSV